MLLPLHELLYLDSSLHFELVKEIVNLFIDKTQVMNQLLAYNQNNINIFSI